MTRFNLNKINGDLIFAKIWETKNNIYFITTQLSLLLLMKISVSLNTPNSCRKSSLLWFSSVMWSWHPVQDSSNVQDSINKQADIFRVISATVNREFKCTWHFTRICSRNKFLGFRATDFFKLANRASSFQNSRKKQNDDANTITPLIWHENQF